METIIPKTWTLLVLVALAAFLGAVSFARETGEIQGASGTTFRPVFDVRQYGAVGDGKHLDTQAVQNAIDACGGSGGGTVYFPGGTYLVGTVILKSHVRLHLESGATILGSSSLEDYDPPFLIYAEKAQNIAITGRGVIDGQGEFFWDENFRALERPGKMIQLEACQDILITGVTLQNSPAWALNLEGCDRVTVDAVSIINPRRGPNTDGLDIVSSSNVFVSNCYIDGGDDCICLKARLEHKPCENVTVTNCVLISDDSAIKLGTRSTGNIRHCVFSNIVIRNTQYGIGLYMKDGGNYEDIQFANISIETTGDPVANYSRGRPAYPIFMDIEPRTDTSGIGSIRNVVFSDISMTTQGGNCLIQGMPDRPVEDVTFDNVRMRISSTKDFSKRHKPRGVRNMPLSPNDYAYVPALFAFAHVRGLTLVNLQVEVADPHPAHELHAIYGIDLQDVSLNGFKGRQTVPDGELATIQFEQCRNVLISGGQALPGTGTFLRLAGCHTESVSLIGNDLSEAKQPFELAKDIRRKAFYRSANRLPD